MKVTKSGKRMLFYYCFRIYGAFGFNNEDKNDAYLSELETELNGIFGADL